MSNRANDDAQTQETDKAWAKLQAKLEHEPVNSVWVTWGKQAANTTEATGFMNENLSADKPGENGMQPVLPAGLYSDADAGAAQPGARKSRRRGMIRSRKWAAMAAGVAIFAAILATPVGNTAMAAILNQFRMQDVAVVDESDIRDIFYQVSEGGSVNDVVNRFGQFTNMNGSISGELRVDKMQAVLGYSAPKGEMFDNIKAVQVSPSRQATIKLNVEAANQALKRLGSAYLLPQSLDGKPIAVLFPEQVNYSLSTDQEHWANLSQMKTPVITVDPSVDVQEAVQAVINFPLLPDHLKSKLNQARVLSGEIPLPLIKGEDSEEITLGGIPVIIRETKYNSGTDYSASWVRNGQMFALSGGDDFYKDKDQFVKNIEELIAQ